MRPGPKWTRHYAGFYSCGNYLIERVDGQYRARWRVRLAGDPVDAGRVFDTLHEAQAFCCVDYPA